MKVAEALKRRLATQSNCCSSGLRRWRWGEGSWRWLPHRGPAHRDFKAVDRHNLAVPFTGRVKSISWMAKRSSATADVVVGFWRLRERPGAVGRSGAGADRSRSRNSTRASRTRSFAAKGRAAHLYGLRGHGSVFPACKIVPMATAGLPKEGADRAEALNNYGF